MVVVPTILTAIFNTPYDNFKKEKVRSMKFIGCGSSILDKTLQDKFEKKFGIPVANLYGSSETGATHFDNPFSPNRKTGNIGRLISSVDAIIVKDGRTIKNVEENGELCIKSPALLKNYFRDDEAYKQCFHGDYFMTGDIVYKDDQEIFYYVDRKKDLIIKGGVNILPSQIDEVLQSHPSIIEAATVGKADIFFGETIKSFVTLKEGDNISKIDLVSFCKSTLGDFKTPSEIEFIKEMPKGPSGKILKRELRKKDLIIE